MTRDSKGFTILEVVLSIAIFGFVFASASILFSAQPFSNLVSSGSVLRIVLEKARLRALAQVGDGSHGVRFEKDKAVLFTGISWHDRDSSRDEIFPLNCELSGASDREIMFSQGSADNLSGKAVDLRLACNGRSAIFTVNQLGVIE